MTDMMKDLNEAISKNLPAAVGTELRKRLEQADREREQLASVQRDLELTTGRLKKTEEERGELQTKLRDIGTREADVAKREKEIQKLELTAQFEKEKADLVRGMFNTVFANRIVRESALVQRENVHRESYSGGGGQENRVHLAVEESKTTEEG